MTIQIKHAKTNAITDWTQAQLTSICAGNPPPLPPAGTTLSQVTLPSDWNAALTTSMAASKLLGRATAGTGSFEELTLGTGLSFTGTTLNAAVTSPGGSDTNIQFNDGGVFGGTAVNYNKTTHRTGFDLAAASTLATVHADGTVTGDTLAAPASLSAVLTLDPAVSSPVTASATQVNGPAIPAAPTINFTYIDIPTDSGSFVQAYINSSGQVTGSGSFIANGQTITWGLYAYRNVGGVKVINPNPLGFTFTDVINDATTVFNMQLGDGGAAVWQTANGYVDGYIISRLDSSIGVTYYKDIGNVTSFNDDGDPTWVTSNPGIVSAYPSSGLSYQGSLAEYKNLGGTKYRTANANGVNTDGSVGSAYLIINATFPASSYDGQYYYGNTGQPFDVAAGISFDDYGQAGTSDISTFASIAFLYFNTALVPATAASAPTFNYGSGNYTAVGDNWNFDVYEYRTNPINGIKYFTGTTANSGNLADAADSSLFTISGSFTPGDGDGRVIQINNSGGPVGSIDIGAASSFTVSPTTTVSVSQGITSYTGMSWAWSAYGNISSPSLKYSATPNNYTAIDNNPTDGFVWHHQWATFGNATGNKVIETAPTPTPGASYDSVVTASNYQLNASLGSSGVSPATLGYAAAGQTVTYRVWSYKSVNGTQIFSGTYATTSVTFNSSGNYYVVDLTSATVSGATYKFQRIPTIVGTGYQAQNPTTLQDNNSVTWNNSSLVTPNVAYGATGILDWNIDKLPSKNPLRIRDTKTGLGNGYIEMQYNTGSAYALASRFGYGADGNARIESYSGGLWVGPQNGNNALIGDPGVGTIINYTGTASSGGRFAIKGQTYTYLMYTDPSLDTVFFGSNSFGFDPQALVAIRDSGGEQGLKFYSSDVGSNSPIMTVVNSSNQAFWGVCKRGAMWVVSNSNGNANLFVGGGTTGVVPFQLGNGPFKSTPVSGAIEYSNDVIGTGAFYGTNNSAIRNRFVQDLGSATSGYFWYSDANGYPTVSGNYLQWQGSYMNTTPDWLFQGNVSLSSNKILAVTQFTITGGVIVGNPKWPYVAKTANFTLTAAEELVNCTANSFNITWPTAVGITGRRHNIKNSGTGIITFLTTSAQTIDQFASGAITLNPNEELTAESNGANWIIISWLLVNNNPLTQQIFGY